MNKTIGVLAIAIALVGASTYLFTKNQSVHTESEHTVMFGSGHTVTMYKDPNCGCCTGYAEALRREGFEVVIEETEDMGAIKKTYNIPTQGESCHTSLIGEYVVEGHVPLEALQKLLTEKPDVVGIGLASMPIGTPGMPGIKTAPYNIYQLSEAGDMSPYLTL